ncbi:phenylalanine--tRNA ligase beta subunit-like [Teleopsis dalmanni]|uniref:phenylalanine--tRNA ligase beta subunit-like n=1 Tax=Teleopsis dalmanni TaxID=139649 RepID=UPI0018CE380E|nr:phenylalanine--tRNA ligase beta subunit-like [Teleopsis dalmanni]
MKFTLSWLYEHLETQATLAEICATLNRIGLEVESVENRGAAIAPFLTARIVEAVQHPNADRLRVCQVDAGPGFENVQVVCGAPNARTGLAVIFAPPGTYVPGLDITIKKGAIRGEASGGMLCSLRELGLGAESDGIAELPEDTLPGQSYADFAGLDEVVIDIAITPNRGDALGVRGIARDLAAAGLGTLRPWLAEAVEGRFPSPVEWANTFPEACPWVLGRTIRGVKNGPSPEWLRNRLESIGLRPISALVDITNYFCFDLGRPLHVLTQPGLRAGG